jgi:hypothetical protein
MSDADQTIGTNRATCQSSLPITKLDYKSQVGSRTEATLTEFATMFYTSLTQQTARGTTMSNLPITKLDYKSLMGSRTETALPEFATMFYVGLTQQIARGAVNSTDFGFKKSIQMVEG